MVFLEFYATVFLLADEICFKFLSLVLSYLVEDAFRLVFFAERLLLTFDLSLEFD